ncbi:MAG: GrpB family protein [Promethearchaeota archaeon]
MEKKLDDMTNEELGMLFPIIIVEPNPEWKSLYSKEKSLIESILGSQNIIRIEHIGSTAVPNLCAKPTIDILLEITDKINPVLIINRFKKINYHFISKPEKLPPHMMFVKGYTINGFEGQAYHIHVRYSDDWDEIYFRDYLIQHPSVAAEYALLKQKLATEFRNDRDIYTERKSKFIKKITLRARKEKK